MLDAALIAWCHASGEEQHAFVKSLGEEADRLEKTGWTIAELSKVVLPRYFDEVVLPRFGEGACRGL